MNRVIWHWVALAMISAGIVAGLIVNSVIDTQVHSLINEQLDLVQKGIHQRFKTFDEFLKQDEVSLDAHVEQVLPELTQHLRSNKTDVTAWSSKELRALAERYEVNEIYIIDQSTRVVATSFLPDMGFELGTISQHVRDMLAGLLGQDHVLVDRFTLSSKTGIMNKYAYFSPAGSDYIFEVSVELKPFLANLRSHKYVQFLFEDMFTDLMGNQMLLKSIDIFLVNDLVVLPFDGNTEPILRSNFPDIPAGQIVRNGDGSKREYFSRIELQGTLLGGVSEYMVIRSRFDQSAADALALKLIVSNSLVLACSMLMIYFLINFILNKTVIQRVYRVNDTLNKISSGDYDVECNVGGNDEITSIANHVEVMKATLAKRESELNQAYGSLEDKVAERTRDLQSEIEKRVAAEKELNILATTDPLTNLPNRRLIDQYLQRALASSGRSGHLTAVLFLDLDNFKYVNDSMGHSAGDVLIKTIAARLAGAIRTSDIAGRLGGDEFIVLLQSLEGDRNMVAQNVQTIAEKILDSVRSAIPIGDHVHHCTLSIGITLSDDYSSPESMYKQADTAMYRAKELGKDNFCFYEASMQDMADQRLLIEKDLRNAIKHNEFFLNYQPQINSYGQLIGAEALIRWQKADGSFVPPDTFIPVAEEIGLILSIGDCVLNNACQQLREWLDAGLMVPHLSVNISAKQFHQDNFVDSVHAAVKRHGLEPERIYLEITETAMLGNRDDIVAKIKELRTLGFAISIDDFGTGYSSLNYLKNLPFDQLKIDKSFIHGIGENADDSAIVNMIISMAVHLNVNLIAEGVENKHQFYYLKQNGCYEYQGYFFGKPMSAEDFMAFAGERESAMNSSAL